MWVFFFKQKTAYEMRISDWSADVCSSDLRQADGEPKALCDFPALAAFGTVRGAAGGRRPFQAEARLLFRRGAPPVRGRPQGAPGEDRAGGTADPFQGRRCLFRDPEPDRHSRGGRRATRQPYPARLRSEEHTSEIPSLMR